MKMKKSTLLIVLMLLSVATPAWAQRSASFVNPNSAPSSGSSGKGSNSAANTVVADPPQIDAGETLVNVARRVTVFFQNGFRVPVQINDLTLNADGNVRSKVLNDDCKTLKTLPVGDKCSIALEVVPTSPGPWSVELLLNHSGLGRIARAEVTGSTLGKADEKSEGLAISKKIAAPLDFGDIKVNEEKAARTMLIENDSNDILNINEIDLIAAEGEGLTIRNTGCKKDDALKPGESCPITVMWEPKARGSLSTDLLVHHSGNMGFVVVPIRGKASSDQVKSASGEDGKKGASSPASAGVSTKDKAAAEALSDMTPPSTAQIAATLPPVVSGTLLPQRESPKRRATNEDTESNPAGPVSKAASASTPIALNLIGTVGGRAILGDELDETHLVGLGEKVNIGGQEVELLQLDPTRAVVNIAGKRTQLSLRNAPSYMGKASASGSSSTSGTTSETKPASAPASSSAPVSDADKAGNQGASIAPLTGAAAAALAN